MTILDGDITRRNIGSALPDGYSRSYLDEDPLEADTNDCPDTGDIECPESHDCEPEETDDHPTDRCYPSNPGPCETENAECTNQCGP